MPPIAGKDGRVHALVSACDSPFAKIMKDTIVMGRGGVIVTATTISSEFDGWE
jgi:hypothetical protein